MSFIERGRRGGELIAGIVISFRRAPLADSYFVALSLSDGRGLRELLTRSRTSVFVAGVAPRVKVTRVAVYGMRAGVAGPRISHRF